jgi:steroid 5-alpha reductase family enzyme
MIPLILTGWAALALGLAFLWWRQLKSRNATSVDVAWATGIGLLSVYFAAVSDGDPARRWIVGGLGAIWAFRLAWHLLRDRVLRHGTEEDGRYKAMREHFGERAQPFFFVFYQGQALVAVLFAVPILAAMQGGAPDLWTFVGAAVWLIAVAGETIADRQLADWRADPSNRGRTCRRGLWRYSRHPNYFFEWVHWFSYVLIGHGAWLTWLGPVLMLLFLFRLTGIPYTEKQALKSRGDDYRAYQRETSVFFPWFPREESHA